MADRNQSHKFLRNAGFSLTPVQVRFISGYLESLRPNRWDSAGGVSEDPRQGCIRLEIYRRLARADARLFHMGRARGGLGLEITSLQWQDPEEEPPPETGSMERGTDL